MKTGCLILAGGKSSRMGTLKSSLEMDGMTFLERLSEELGRFGEVVASVDQASRHAEIKIPMIEDIYPDHGPMGGIYSAFVEGDFDVLLTVPCDVPLFSGDLAMSFCDLLSEEADAVIAVTEDKRVHPFCGIYKRSCLPVLHECLEKQELRMMQALKKMNVVYAETGEASWQLQNINTPEEYEHLIKEWCEMRQRDMKMTIETITEAAELLCSLTEGVSSEQCQIEEAYGRVLAEEADAVISVPYFRRSAYDGYALRSADTVKASEETPVILKVTEALAAGDVPQHIITEGYAARIMTGAAVPEGADAVVMHERTVFTDSEVRLTAPVKPGNIVQIGEDVKKGIRLLDTGRRLTASDIALLAGQGISEVTVYRKPRAAIISTGSELLSPKQPLEYGKIYSTNSYLLGGYLRRYGIIPVHTGIVADDPDALGEAIGEALLHSDIVITTGGVSAGDYDYLPDAIQKLGGDILFHRLRFKPGGAMLAARKGQKLILGLSGNPGAAATGMLCVGLPCMKKLCGLSETGFQRAQARLTEAFTKPCPVTRVLKGKASYMEGMMYFTPLANQKNGSVSSMDDCDLLAIVPEGTGPLEKGTMLDVYII